MKKSNSKQKALGAFKKLGAVALITATLAMFFTACNQAGGGGGEKPTPTPKPKHAITFSVDGANGTLKAKADGVDETSTSPITVEEGKTVTFTATANDGYRVKGWTLDGKAVNGSNNSYSFTVSKAVSVKVSFEDNSTPKPKHAITFNVDGGNGTLKAKVDGNEITSGKEVEEGKEVTFTAEPSTNYKVKEWKVGDTVVTGNKTTTYTHTVTQAVTVKVSFESNSTPPAPQTKYTVTLTQTGGGKVTASPAIPADGQVAKDTEITFTATANAGYRVGTWSVTPSEAIQSGGGEGETTATVKITADTTVSVNFEAIPEVAILTLSEKKLIIKVKAKTSDGKPIEVEGCTETTLASDVETTLNAKGTKVILKGKITELDCPFNKLSGLNVQGLTALQKLDCSRNQFVKLNASGLTALQNLDCSWNHWIKSLNIQGLTSLQELSCNHNALTELDLQGLTALQKLKCSVNKLDKLNVQGLTSLQRLECDYNGIIALDLQGLTSLGYLACSQNQLRTLNASDLTALQQLWCSNNKLTTLDVQGCTALEKLSCWNNNLNALNVQGCTALKSLICWCNKLNAQAMTALLNALPARKVSDDAEAQLYTEQSQSTSEGNWNDYTKPEDLKKAFEGAKSRNWKLKVQRKLGGWDDI